MDVTDYRIIEILQKDGRISMKDLGKIVGLTSPAVSERVKRLEESGVIEGYKAIVNPDALGRVIKAFIHIALPSDKYELFLETARKDPRIVECHHITGDDCSLLKVIVGLSYIVLIKYSDNFFVTWVIYFFWVFRYFYFRY